MANDYFDFLSQNAQQDNPTNTSPQNDGMVNLTARADAECQVVCDGDFLFLLNANQITKESAPVGQHILQFISIDHPDIIIEKIVDFPEAGKNYLVMVNEFSKAIAETKAKAEEPAPVVKMRFKTKLGEEGDFEGTAVDGLPEGKGKVVFDSGSVYEGEFKGGWRHGLGTFKMDDGSIYEGDFKEDMRTGKGKLIAPDGRKWEGEFLDGKAHGKVKFFFKNGDVLEGIWENGNTANKPNVYTWQNGDRLECEGWDGGSHGRGVYYWKDGRQEEQTWSHGHQDKNKASIEWTLFINGIKGKYTGDVLNGVPNGKGHFESTEGDLSKYPYTYDGDWVDGKRKGKGSNLLPSYDKYEGEFVGDRRNGYGIMQYRDGGRYEGEWKDGQRQGKGKYVSSDGNGYEGDWENDEPNGEGTIFQWMVGSGTVGRYTGHVWDGKPHGKGHFEVTKDSLSYPHEYPYVYDGDWYCGLRQGKGKNTWPNGEVYDGEWYNGKRHGRGVVTTANGWVHQGVWENGKKK